MIKNGKGGGNTKTGLVFEGKTDLATFLNSQNGYRVTDDVVFYNDEKVARITYYYFSTLSVHIINKMCKFDLFFIIE